MKQNNLDIKVILCILLAILVYISILLRPEILLLLIILLLLLGLYFQITPDTIKRIIRWLEGDSTRNVETDLPKSKKKPLPKLAIKTPKIISSRVINLKKAKQAKDSKSNRHNPRRKRLG